MTIIEKIYLIFIILFILTAVILFASVVIISWIEVKKEEAEYNKSLFRYLKILQNKILKEYRQKEPDEVIKEFSEISKKILRLNNSHSTKIKIGNMRLIDSLTYHELKALKKVNESLNVGVLLTDEKIQEALVVITKGLDKQYTEFCHLKTADVEEETYILKVLEQKKSERLDFTNSARLDLINENEISLKKND